MRRIFNLFDSVILSRDTQIGQEIGAIGIIVEMYDNWCLVDFTNEYDFIIR